jgi:UTP--glucose-1-phosphate uridylyltransferase
VPNPVRKVVIPAAGLGTRFLPATKAIPKEMLPILDRPLIQLAVEEAAASGIETVIMVIGKGKNILSEHFRRDEVLENILTTRGRTRDVEILRRISALAEIRTVLQERPLGLADAIRSTRQLVGDEPFAVILPDALIDAQVPCTFQLMKCYQKRGGCVVATELVEPWQTGSFGMLDVVPVLDEDDKRTLRVISMVERPRPGQTRSLYGIFGRYILTPEIFSYIEKTSPGFNGELQLTDAISLCLERTPVYAYHFEGQHFDAGSKRGFLMATLAYALKDPELSQLLLKDLAALELRFTSNVN